MKHMITTTKKKTLNSGYSPKDLLGFFSLIIFLIGSGSTLTASASGEPVCDNFVYYLSNHPLGTATTDIYKVTLNGANADLEYIISSDEEVHIAYNSNDNLIYAVGRNSHSYKTVDPNAATPTFSPTVDLGDSLSIITAAVFSPGGKLVFGSTASQRIYSVDLSTNLVSLYDAHAPVHGGDLAYASNGMLYLASDIGTGLYEVWPDGIMPDQLLPGAMPNGVTGMAITDVDQLLISSRGNTNLVLRNTDGSNAGSFAVKLNGSTFTLGSGDMASGCVSESGNVGADCGYKLYYVHSPAGGGNQPLLEVTLNSNGTASYTELIANIGGHIGLSPDGSTIYNVGSKLRIIDVASASVVSTKNIKTAGGVKLTSFPACLVSSDGTLYAGNSGQNQVYKIDPETGIAIPYGPNRNVAGGDLIELDGEIWVVNRSQNKFINVMTGDSFTVPVTQMNGAAVLSNGNVIVADGNGGSLMKEIDPITHEVVGTYDIGLLLHNGDLAGACTDIAPPVEECNYKLYLAHSPLGAGPYPILEVTLNNDGSASYNEIVPDLAGHIALSLDGSTIYHVFKSTLKVIDVATSSVVSTANVKTEGGVAITPIPAIVVGADGTVYIGGAATDQVYTVDPVSGIAIPYGPSRSVGGGDLIEVAGEIWVITRNNSMFTNVLTGDNFTVPVPEIFGAAVLSNGNVLLSEGNSSLLSEIDFSTHSVVATYDIGLPMYGGDLAGRCIISDPIIEGCYGAEVIDFNQGLQTNGSAVAANRSDATKALGEPDRSNAPGGFVSLGVGGSITIAFAGVVNDAPGADIKIWETSYKGDVCGGSGDERADIELSYNGINWASAGTICLDGEVDMADAGLTAVRYIRITNATSTSSLDGYDVDGVEAINGCSSEPEVINGECYAAEVVEYIEGVKKNSGAINSVQTNSDNALGIPERATSGYSYVSLGYGGSIILGFNGAVPNGAGDDIEIVETTYGNYPTCASYPEYAKVYVSVDGINWIYAKTVCKYDGFVDISDADASLDYINYVKIVNDNELSTTPDAFDVDGVVALHNCTGLRPASQPVEEQTQMTTSPNPSTGSSEVIFSTAKTGQTYVDVYDMNGRKIATIFDQVAQEGQEYRINFNGLSLPNGFYVYVLTNNNETTIERFLIAK